MKHDRMMYNAFLVEYKIIKQCYPNICKEERFIRAIVATSDDRWKRSEVLNQGKIGQFNGKLAKTVFSDALTRRR